jgi:decaprenyl-phosphate phosphoribosyltransferase
VSRQDTVGMTASPAVRTVLPALLRGARPAQWSKNLLLLGAPVAAGVIGHGHVLVRVALGIVAFCLTASGGYLVNDAIDADRDRRHPEKRHRPVASGALPAGLATAVGVALTIAGVAVAAVVGPALAAWAIAYAALAAAYSARLRDVAVVDLAAVAGFFIVRAIAGGAAAGVPLSRWFLIVTSFAALFAVAGKRYCERISLSGGTTRSVLREYSPEYLRFVWMVAAAVTLTAYCVWAFQRIGTDEIPWYELSIVPFVLGVLRYGLLIDMNAAAAPEQTLASDRPLQMIPLMWVTTFACGAYSLG